MERVMSEEHYNPLAKALDESHLCECYDVFQKKDRDGKLTDYIIEYDFDGNDKNRLLPLKKGLKMINDNLVDFVLCYGFTDEDIEGYDSLMKEFGIKTESCRNR